MDHSLHYNAFIGLTASMVAVVTSFQQEIEWWLRISTSVVGLLIGILSLITMVKKLRSRGKGDDKAPE
jgi:cytochrome c biogenesis protein CcdA